MGYKRKYITVKEAEKQALEAVKAFECGVNGIPYEPEEKKTMTQFLKNKAHKILSEYRWYRKRKGGMWFYCVSNQNEKKKYWTDKLEAANDLILMFIDYDEKTETRPTIQNKKETISLQKKK